MYDYAVYVGLQADALSTVGAVGRPRPGKTPALFHRIRISDPGTPRRPLFDAVLRDSKLAAALCWRGFEHRSPI